VDYFSKNQLVNVVVTGATGTLGKAVIDKLLTDERIYITGISRDEQKQRLMPKHPRLKMRLADVRDMSSIADALRTYHEEYDVFFHFAALKCVDTIEENPREAHRTNVVGTENIVNLAKHMEAKVVLASTDKAVYPVNTYGVTKALAERFTLSASPNNVVCRYGNVLGSRGSILESLGANLKNNRRAYLTDERMTRFWLTLNDARDFVIHCAFSEKTGLQLPFFVKSSRVSDLIKVTAKLLGVEDYSVENIGVRAGEKIHESLCTEYESGYKKNVASNDDDRLMGEFELSNLVAKALGL
jgi:UDP-N-acetylglucosamine 4,6-dehydratase